MFRGFIKEGNRLNGSWLARIEEVGQVLERQTGIDDVFDDDDMAIGNVFVEVFNDSDDTGRFRTVRVAGHGDKVHKNSRRHLSAEVGVEEGRAFQDADKERVFSGVVGRELIGEFLNACRNLFLCEEDAADVGFFILDVH